MLDASVKARKPFYCSNNCVTWNFPFPRIAFDWTGQYFLPYNPFRGRQESCAYFLFFIFKPTSWIVIFVKKTTSCSSAFLYILVIVHKNTSLRSLTRLKNLKSLKSPKILTSLQIFQCLNKILQLSIFNSNWLF